MTLEHGFIGKRVGFLVHIILLLPFQVLFQIFHSSSKESVAEYIELMMGLFYIFILHFSVAIVGFSDIQNRRLSLWIGMYGMYLKYFVWLYLSFHWKLKFGGGDWAYLDTFQLAFFTLRFNDYRVVNTLVLPLDMTTPCDSRAQIYRELVNFLTLTRIKAGARVIFFSE